MTRQRSSLIGRLKGPLLAALVLAVLTLNIYLLYHYYHNHRPKIELPKGNEPYDPDAKENQVTSAEKMHIPKIIHLMWAERLVPTKHLQYVRKWRQLNKDWKIYFWNDQYFEKLLNTKYSHLKNAYNGLKPHDKIVSRRYFIIHQYGGVWADLDVEPLKPFDSLIQSQMCILSQEPEINAKLGWRIERMIGAAIFACVPRHPFFEMVLNLLMVNGKDPHTLAASGSVMLSRVYFSYRDLLREMYHPRGAVFLAEPNIFMPLLGESYLNSLAKDCDKMDDVRPLRKPFCDIYKPLDYKNLPIPAGSYAVHHWFRSWTKGGDIDPSSTDKRDIFEWMRIEKPPDLD